MGSEVETMQPRMHGGSAIQSPDSSQYIGTDGAKSTGSISMHSSMVGGFESGSVLYASQQ